GLNDGLNGVERPVSFDVLDVNRDVEIVHSLAKWKRNALGIYGFKPGEGLYTDMNAIRRDEKLDNLHSVYVDQWDWELIINKEDRNLFTLKKVVRKIYKTLLKVEQKINKQFPELKNKLADDITFISTKQLEKQYPDLSPKEREDVAAKEFGSIFVYQIGWPLSNKEPHDGRAFDYDDWKLNGDIIVYNEVLGHAFELSSMGIRVDATSLAKQAKCRKCLDQLENPYCQKILNEELPYTIGGGIGQSRLCMFFLEKLHIGEVQASIWSEEDLDLLKKNNINIL
ncbi:MAG: aspartate--ammonia ligase, partial [Bacilli bacterium]|nr:aspartate--ammonia ligase [Bacilli bacterium]